MLPEDEDKTNPKAAAAVVALIFFMLAALGCASAIMWRLV